MVSSVSAASWAEKPSTSRRISTARWLAGRCWSAATKASSTRLALLVAGLGRGVAVLEAERLVRVGLDPDRLDQRLAGAVVGIGGGP